MSDKQDDIKTQAQAEQDKARAAEMQREIDLLPERADSLQAFEKDVIPLVKKLEALAAKHGMPFIFAMQMNKEFWTKEKGSNGHDGQAIGICPIVGGECEDLSPPLLMAMELITNGPTPRLVSTLIAIGMSDAIEVKEGRYSTKELRESNGKQIPTDDNEEAFKADALDLGQLADFFKGESEGDK